MLTLRAVLRRGPTLLGSRFPLLGAAVLGATVCAGDPAVPPLPTTANQSRIAHGSKKPSDVTSQQGRLSSKALESRHQGCVSFIGRVKEAVVRRSLLGLL